MTRPSWLPVAAAAAGAVAAAWILPEWAAIPVAGALVFGTVVWPAIRKRRNRDALPGETAARTKARMPPGHPETLTGPLSDEDEEAFGALILGYREATP